MIFLAVLIFYLSVRCSRLEILFLVLVVLNLYVNIMVVGKVMGHVHLPFSCEYQSCFMRCWCLSVISPCSAACS